MGEDKMSDYIIHFFISMFAVWSAMLLHGFVFALFKADKYERHLEDKIAEKVVEKLKEIL